MPGKRAKKAKLPAFSLVIPIRNGGALFGQCLHNIAAQTARPAEVLIFDTESTDGSPERAMEMLRPLRVKVFPVRRQEFDHGGTRNRALKEAKYPWVLFLTQDALCADSEAFAKLMSAATGRHVAAVYGRQLPHGNATPLAATARAVNYGPVPRVQAMNLAGELGIKTWFCSNSFCAWNRQMLIAAGGFAEKLILGEDMHAAARLIQAGNTVVYEPSAQVFHSHNYTAIEEFHRYFDTGVFHAMHEDLLFRAGNPSKEGFRFLWAQLRSLAKQNAWLSVLKFPFHIAAKFLGYKLGRKFTLLGTRAAHLLSMHKNFWS